MTIIRGEAIAVMQQMADKSIDAIVTDPPYGLGFMGKKWDDLPPGEDWARECLRVLKPGGHLLAFGGTRTWHRLAVAVEDAGFEIRDSIAWMHGQGFPKGKSQLKPAFEPIVLARKAFKGSMPFGLNVDECRIGDEMRINAAAGNKPGGAALNMSKMGMPQGVEGREAVGRWPANVVLDEDQAAALDVQSGTLKSGVMPVGTPKQGKPRGIYGEMKPQPSTSMTYGDQGGASRFFHIAREDDFPCCSGGAETDIDTNGLSGEPPARGGGSVDAPAEQLNSSSRFLYCAKAPKNERPVVDGVAHPTVKPLSLMRWLVRLVTPAGGTVLDPFAGSGTTVEAALLEGFSIVAIEREAEYLPLIEARVARVSPVARDT